MPLTDIVGQSLVSATLMSRTSGRGIDDLEHLKQCIVDILLTPLGSRVMRRDYGSDLLKLVDHPIGPLLGLKIRMAVVTALNKWEPRLRLTQITIDNDGFTDGSLTFALEGYYLLQGRSIRLSDISLDFFKTSRYATQPI